jgi:hypothetical protein
MAFGSFALKVLNGLNYLNSDLHFSLLYFEKPFSFKFEPRQSFRLDQFNMWSKPDALTDALAHSFRQRSSGTLMVARL